MLPLVPSFLLAPNVVVRTFGRQGYYISWVGSSGGKSTRSEKTLFPLSILRPMPQLINIGRELLRINSAKNVLEYSTSDGRSWLIRCPNPSYGQWRDLLLWGGELLAVTSKGIYASTNGGNSWVCRAQNSAIGGEFYTLQDGGSQLLSDTTRGLQYSTNNGRSWLRR